MEDVGRIIIIMGVVLVVLGLLITFSGSLSLPKLPGDIYIKRDGFTFYFPIVTSIIVSIVLTLLINLFTRK